MNIVKLKKTLRTLLSIYSPQAVKSQEVLIYLINKAFNRIEESLLRDSPLIIIQQCLDVTTLLVSLEANLHYWERILR